MKTKIRIKEKNAGFSGSAGMGILYSPTGFSVGMGWVYGTAAVAGSY